MSRLAVLFLLAATPALAQQPAPQRPAPPSAATPARPAAEAPRPAAPEPDRTTATFGDWTLRCEARAEPPQSRQCEIVQSLQDARGQTIATFALGRTQPTAALRFVAVLPVNVSVGAPFRLVAQEGQPVLEVPLRACGPRGCLADASLDAATTARLRERDGPGRFEMRDATGQEAALPVSFRGLAAALAVLERR